MNRAPLEPTKPFTTDGCSGGMTTCWTIFTGAVPPWNGCCVEHDRAYWRGGTRRERFLADVHLMLCVANRGHRTLAVLMFLAVRLFGGPYWPFTWRWAYGHRRGHGYRYHNGAKE